MSVQVCEEAYVACVELLLPHIFIYLFLVCPHLWKCIECAFRQKLLYACVVQV